MAKGAAKLQAERSLAMAGEALRLRLQGATYERIAREVGYSDRANAHRAVKGRMAEMRDECAELTEEVRQQELARLDAMLELLWGRIEEGDLAAMDRVLRIMERRTAYLGLDAPKQAAVATVDMTSLTGTTREQQLALAEAAVSALRSTDGGGDGSSNGA